LPRLGIHLGTGIVALIVNAFIGAVVLLLIFASSAAGEVDRGGGEGGGADSGQIKPISAHALMGGAAQ
jgi:hypothetical protein